MMKKPRVNTERARPYASRIVVMVVLCFAGFASANGQSPSTATVSIKSLLTEMIDRDSIARFPATDFRLKQHSSYARESKSPDDAKSWFSNNDKNTNERSRNFIRVEENEGQKEWVLMDHNGPGAIVRTWMPFRSAGNPDTDIQIRIYLDGSDQPALEGNMLGLLNGTGVIPFPLAHKSLRSAVSFFPIPYAKSCKVTTTGQPFFYQFTFREYAQDTDVQTFRMDEFEAATSLTQQVGETLLNPGSRNASKPLSFNRTLAAGEEKQVALPAGVSAVRELSVKLGDYDDPNVTRSVVLKMEFDGKKNVWCPIGDFFGSGIGLHPFQGWYRTVAEDGTMTCRWVMPYQKTGKVSLVNLADKPIDAEMKITTGDWEWDDSSLYFHAAFRGQYPVATRPYSDWNYVTLKGRGVYVGDTLTIMNPVERWWGEGDEKIWVDGEDFPSIFGTGTEDYYAYSWGGVSTDFYEHPFHAQPRCNIYNKLNRKTSTERNTQGYSTETRTRSLDTMPFGSSLQLDMEIWSWSDCDMGYGVGTYWYGDLQSTSNRNPDATEALNVPAMPDLTSQADTSGVPTQAKGFAGAIEIEDMTIVTKPATMKVVPQSLKSYKGNWSKRSHLLFKNDQPGNALTLSFPAQSPVAEKLTLHATKSRDYGILRVFVNGKEATADVDLYSAKPTSTGPIPLGDFEAIDGDHTLRVEVAGKNPKSKGVFFGIDCVIVEPAAVPSK